MLRTVFILCSTRFSDVADDWSLFLTTMDTSDIDTNVNTRLIPYPGLLRTASWWEVSFKVLCYMVLVVVALCGNGMVVRTVYRNKGRMRATTYYYLVNLAVCDIVITVFCTWVHLVADLNEGWVLGAFFCKFSSFIQGRNDDMYCDDVTDEGKGNGCLQFYEG